MSIHLTKQVQARIANIILIAVSLFLVGVSLASNAQSLYGSWYNANYQATLTLNADGSYAFASPYSNSMGYYQASATELWLQDQAGTTVGYYLQGLSATQLNLADANGNAFIYTRQQNRKMPWSDAQYQAVLSTKNGHELNGTHLKVYTEFVEFVVGEAIEPDEEKSIRTELTAQFNANPAGVLQEAEGFKASMAQLYGITDPMAIGAARQMIFAGLYQGTHHLPENEQPVLMQIINNYVQILAFDPATNLVLLDKEVEAAIQYMEFASNLNGAPLQWSAHDKQQFQQQAAANFTQLTLQEKQFLCSASLLWELVANNWNQISTVEQQQWQNNYQSQAVAPNYDYSGSANQTIADKQAEMRTNQMYFDIMNDMSLQNHATMLNVIEGMGGSDNYWEVTNSPY